APAGPHDHGLPALACVCVADRRADLRLGVAQDEALAEKPVGRALHRFLHGVSVLPDMVRRVSEADEALQARVSDAVHLWTAQAGHVPHEGVAGRAGEAERQPGGGIRYRSLGDAAAAGALQPGSKRLARMRLAAAVFGVATAVAMGSACAQTLALDGG